jgi:hypothetical protein
VKEEGSGMDIIRNEIFEDYKQNKKWKYFSDIFDIKNDKKEDIRSCEIKQKCTKFFDVKTLIIFGVDK